MPSGSEQPQLSSYLQDSMNGMGDVKYDSANVYLSYEASDAPAPSPSAALSLAAVSRLWIPTSRE